MRDESKQSIQIMNKFWEYSAKHELVQEEFAKGQVIAKQTVEN